MHHEPGLILRCLGDPLSVIRRHKTAFIVMHAAFFLIFLATASVTFVVPDLQPVVADLVSRLVRADLALQIYLTGNVLLAASATLAVNMGVAVLLISLPSFAVPFFGVAFALLFAATYGVTLAPIGPHAAAMLPHSIAMLIEFEAYIVSGFGAYLAGRTAFFPPRDDARPFAQRYRAAIQLTLSLYILVVPLLVIGAIYEAFEIIFLVRYFVI